MGRLKVAKQGSCRRPKWSVEWLTEPGDQPLMKVDGSAVVGKDVVVSANEKKKGGLLIRGLTGDFFRVVENKPQVEVHINGIPSKCSGDCSFEWSEEETPVVTGISPSSGSSGLGTLLTRDGLQQRKRNHRGGKSQVSGGRDHSYHSGVQTGRLQRWDLPGVGQLPLSG
ncbi:fibrocystin-L-like [Odontesthes bonariensis]|uniref:fibrocystin-L-like n=1 Tax=Odontesthes bonariensis TaxID=219752 RepID=UPI003F5859EB